ncbi:MAG: serine--tRNA ligase [Candidatus Colwellbacteria bacterium]|nr:serine--tRNA ligase [Candidatus Colwellbacteria bacterium]
MLDVNLIRKEKDLVKEGVKRKNISPKIVDDFLALDERWKTLTAQLDNLRRDRSFIKEGPSLDAKNLKSQIKQLDAEIKEVSEKRNKTLVLIPNIPANVAPVGKDESGNVVLREVGEKPNFKFKPKDYMALAGNMINMESAGQVSGSRFGYILGDLVLLEFSLVQLAMDKLVEKGFIPVVPPVMVKPEIMKAMGKVKFIEGDDAFHVAKDNLYLVGSSEHSIGPLHMDSVLDGKSLPRRYAGFSTCFRREAGSYGKDTKGILRVHQFDKVEMFSFTKPEDSEKEHQFLLGIQEELMQVLKLPYQVIANCTGDMGFGDYKQFDIEVYLPGQGKYRELCSTSNTTDYQARGLNIKYREGEKKDFVHTLNATAFAIGRTLIAILENYQNEDGGVTIPKALQGYVKKKKISGLALD